LKNHPDHRFGVDFTIFGNPLSNWSEPGIVSVMKDENGNGLADDTWYELAGSDYFFSSSIRGYEVTYVNPNSTVAADVPWSDNKGNEGVIRANSFFTQPYYPLPELFSGIDQEQYTLKGSMIRSTVDTAYESTIYSLKRGFGYADNQFRGKAPYTLPDNPYTNEVENAGGDAFDISWAVDGEGNPVELDEIHFIKVHTGVMDGAGWLGQISTEITGASIAVPDGSVEGAEELIVIREIPPVLASNEYQLEAFAFRNGKYLKDENISWSASLPEAAVDENNVLHVNQSGDLTLTATMSSNTAVSSTVTTTVALAVSTETTPAPTFNIYPNPAAEFISISGGEAFSLKIYELSGRQVMQKDRLLSGETVNIGSLPSGLYILEIRTAGATIMEKFMKN
jgi:hypothetical protein